MGRKLGMSAGDIRALKTLEKNNLPPDEWALLTWVQEWTFAGGRDISSSHRVAVREHYTRKEIRYFRKLMDMMIFANYFSLRFLSGRKKRQAACPLPHQDKGTADEEK